METYNYDDSNAVSGFTGENQAAAAMPASGNDVPAAPGFGPSGSVAPSLPGNGNDVSAAPGFDPSGSVTPSLPGNGNDVPAAPGFGPIGPVTPSLPSGGSSGGIIIRPNPGILWTWGTLSPFFSTSADIAHVRFYNAAAIREPLDIYLNGRLLVSNLDYMNYTRYLHIIPGIYRLTVFRRTNPQSAIIDTSVRFHSGVTYTLTILGTEGDYSVQMLTS